VTAMLPSAETYGKADVLSLLALLWRKRLIVLVVAILTSGTNLVFLLLRPLPAEIRTVIEIGNAGNSLVEPVDVVRQKINDIYSVAAENDVRATAPNGSNIRLNIRPRIARNSNIVILESSAPLEQLDLYRTFHSKVFEFMSQDHNRSFWPLKAALESAREEQLSTLKKLEGRASVDPKRSALLAQVEENKVQEQSLKDDRIFGVSVKSLESEISIADKSLKDLQGEEQILIQTRRQQDISAKSYTDGIERLKSFLTDSRARNSKVSENSTGSGEAMASLLFDAERFRTEIELQRLERALTVDLPLERAQTEDQLLQNRRQQQVQEQALEKSKAELVKFNLERDQKLAVLNATSNNIRSKLTDLESSRLLTIPVQKAKLQEIETRLSNLLVTRVVVPPRRNQEGENSRMFFAGLALLAGLGLGLLAGVFAVFKDAMTSRSAQRV